MKAIIMAAGKSTRTYPLTVTRPKPLLRAGAKSILGHQLDYLEGIADTVVVVVGYRKEMIQDAFGESYNGIRIEYVEQKEQLGTGHAILQCASLIDGPFLAMNGDDLYDPRDLRRLAESEQAALAKSVADPTLYGIYDVDEAGRAIRLVEKPKEVFSTLANVGAYKFTPTVFEVLEATGRSERGEIEITSAIQTLADRGDFRVLEMQGFWLPIGYPWSLLDVNKHVLDTRLEVVNNGEIASGVNISGPVHIGRGTRVLPGVVIDGPVYIGEDCTIGPNCWIRPYTTLGNGCRVGQGSETKGAILFDGAAAPHQNYVGDSVIGEKVNLGCGTVTANLRHDNANVRSMVKDKLVDTGRRKCGAFIGDGVHTGIHTSIYPGRKIWPGVGTPPNAVVDRDLTV